MPRSDRRVVPVLVTAPPRRGFLSVLAALAFPAACADAAGPPVFPPPDGLPTPISCPGFTVVDTQITVEPNGGIQPIGGGHRLEFAPNAVSGLSNYYVRRGPTAGRAEIDIVPQGA
ncbi:MAG TPA: hypothetical protein VMM12_18590, partial [Longimicrobiales bacterium]|nr:hypothetical protein [Longimicrobiales bacterium]